MKKLLATLGLFLFLTSPALADHIVLQHNVEYTDYVITCQTELDARAFARSLNNSAKRSNELTTKMIEVETFNHKCSYHLKQFYYNEGAYVCGFSILYHNFSILNMYIDDRIKGYMIVNSTASNKNSNKIFASCSLRDSAPVKDSQND